jgi:hypothetical protein
MFSLRFDNPMSVGLAYFRRFSNARRIELQYPARRIEFRTVSSYAFGTRTMHRQYSVIWVHNRTDAGAQSRGRVYLPPEWYSSDVWAVRMHGTGPYAGLCAQMCRYNAVTVMTQRRGVVAHL